MAKRRLSTRPEPSQHEASRHHYDYQAGSAQEYGPQLYKARFIATPNDDLAESLKSLHEKYSQGRLNVLREKTLRSGVSLAALIEYKRTLALSPDIADMSFEIDSSLRAEVQTEKRQVRVLARAAIEKSVTARQRVFRAPLFTPKQNQLWLTALTLALPDTPEEFGTMKTDVAKLMQDTKQAKNGRFLLQHLTLAAEPIARKID